MLKRRTHDVKKLKKTDKELLEIVRSLYSASFSVQDIPELLRTEDKEVKFLFIKFGQNQKAINAPDLPKLHKEFWRDDVGKDSLLKTQCFDCISLICSYQSEHLNLRGKVTNNHRGDVSILILELIKVHIVNISKGNETTYDSIIANGSELNKLLEFLRQLINNSELFPQSKSKKKTSRLEVFHSLRAKLTKLSDDIYNHSLATSAYLDLKKAIDQSTDLLCLSVAFLHNLLRKSLLSQEEGILTFRNPVKPNDIKHMQSQYIGQVMQLLLNSNVFLLLFPDGFSQGVIALEQLQEQMLSQNNCECLRPVFPINESELSRLDPNLSPLVDNIQREIKNPTKTGIQKDILDREILQKVILLHGLVEEFGVCILVCRSIWNNSKDFGDFGVYGILSESSQDVARTTSYYINKILDLSQDIVQKLQIVSERLVTDKKAKKIQRWTTNFIQSQTLLQTYKRDMVLCQNTLTRIEAKALRGITAEQFEQMLRRLDLTKALSARLQQRRQGNSITQRRNSMDLNNASNVNRSRTQSSYAGINSMLEYQGSAPDQDGRHRSRSQPVMLNTERQRGNSQQALNNYRSSRIVQDSSHRESAVESSTPPRSSKKTTLSSSAPKIAYGSKSSSLGNSNFRQSREAARNGTPPSQHEDPPLTCDESDEYQSQIGMNYAIDLSKKEK